MDETKAVEFKVTNAWMGITDKYWAGTLLPSPKANVQARFSSNLVGTCAPTRPITCSIR
jgi:YidC/Oxa1 family membrane protein insertase